MINTDNLQQFAQLITQADPTEIDKIVSANVYLQYLLVKHEIITVGHIPSITKLLEFAIEKQYNATIMHILSSVKINVDIIGILLKHQQYDFIVHVSTIITDRKMWNRLAQEIVMTNNLDLLDRINASKQFNYKTLMYKICKYCTIGESDRYDIRLDIVKWLVDHSEDIAEYTLDDIIFSCDIESFKYLTTRFALSDYVLKKLINYINFDKNMQHIEFMLSSTIKTDADKYKQYLLKYLYPLFDLPITLSKIVVDNFDDGWDIIDFICHNNEDLLKYVLEKNIPIDLEKLLIKYIKGRNVDMVKFLVAYGVDVYTTPTAVDNAIDANNQTVLQILIDAGANINTDITTIHNIVLLRMLFNANKTQSEQRQSQSKIKRAAN